MSNARTSAVVLAALVILAGCQSQTTYIKWRAQQGDPGAQYALGDIYSKGEGVPRDALEAVKWFRKAAEQGHASAQYALVLYSSRVPEWEEWLRLAARQGHVQAQLYLASRYRDGDRVKAVKWYRKAAEQGHWSAQEALADCYIKGEGVTQNYIKAHAWLNQATGASSSFDREMNIGELESAMTPDQLSQARQLSAEIMERIEAAKNP